MVEFLSSQTLPQNKPSTPAYHTRSRSSPYFQHTRTFISDDLQDGSPTFRNSLQAPITTSNVVATPIKPSSARLQRHNRSLTSTAIPRPPLITTDIKVESAPAVLSSSIFSGSSPIKFDLSPPESPALSPKDKWSFLTSFKADKELPERSPSPLRISNWFQGESAPINLGLTPSPTKETPSPFQYNTMSAETRSIIEPSKANKANSFFSSFFANKSTTTIPIPQDTTNDEFFNLDIKRALQLPGQFDPFSPSSFKNLQQHAEGLLARMQIAYRHRVLAINNIKAEQEAQQEEHEEAQTRADHLKIQLDSLSAQLDEKKHEMEMLRQELEEEKRLRQEEAQKNRTIRLVDDDKPFDRRTRSRTSLGSTASTPSMLSDADSLPSEMPDPFVREDTPTLSGPFTPRSAGWPLDHQFLLSGTYKNLDQVGHTPPESDPDVFQENIQLKSRVGHLEKELDNCLDILKGFGL